LVAGIVVLVVYLLTLAPGLTWAHWGADGGDFVTAALTGRVPHPPGFPLYTWIAGAFVRLPWRTPAWRLNLLSALSGAGAVLATTVAVRRRGHGTLVAGVTGVTLGFAPLLWSQAVITEVYALATCLVAVMLWWREQDMGTRRWALIAGVLWGGGVAVHPTLLFLAPLWSKMERKIRPLLLGGFLFGLTPYLLLPLCGPWPQPWGDLRTIRGWWIYVSARLYHGFAFTLPAAQWPQRLAAWGKVMVQQFTPLGAVTALLGLRERGDAVRPALLSLLLVSVYAIGYNTADSLVYLTALLPLLALWLSDGIASLTTRGIPVAVWLLLPALLLALNWGQVNLTGEDDPRRWAEAVLDEAPPAAVVVTSRDAHTFALWYAQAGLEVRPDVTVIDRDLWAQAAYRAFLRSNSSRDLDSPDVDEYCKVTEEGLACP
jgi:hypothetical protein